MRNIRRSDAESASALDLMDRKSRHGKDLGIALITRREAPSVVRRNDKRGSGEKIA